MPAKESSRRPSQSRRRIDEASRRKDNRKRKSGHGKRPETGSDEGRDERRAARGERRSERQEEEPQSRGLSIAALAELDRENQRQKKKPERPKRAKKEYREIAQDARHVEPAYFRDEGRRDKRKRRVVSGAVMEEGRVESGLRGGAGNEGWRWSEQSLEKADFYQRKSPKKSKKKLCEQTPSMAQARWTITNHHALGIMIGVGIVILIIIIAVAVAVSKKNSGGGGGGGEDGKDDGDKDSGASDLDGQDRKDIPDRWKNSYLDPWSWKTTTDFNTTFTAQMVGDLPVMGLFSEWDDSARANDKVPPLDEKWGSYKSSPARGVNLGGWLAMEPFITPSLFNYDSDKGIIDEWSLCQELGPRASSVLEEHYASFVTENTFKDIAEAGLDHIRIPFSYWAVEVYDGDPYVFRTSWRYLLRGIEWARKYGLRVKLDVHGLPGSQNGWNHSGRLGQIGWLNGTDGTLNAQRSLDMHDRLSKFFAQDRYKNIITHYGLANEPRMTELKASDVIEWTENAYKKVRDNGLDALVVFGDGFMGLDNWQGLMTGYDDMVLDVHQYVIFNEGQISFTHKEKVEYACKGWTDQAELSMDRNRGYGPTMFAEWSQADTDCTPYLNHGSPGSRWEGTLASVTSPKCPTGDDQCSCDVANAGPDKWSDQYKKFLQMFAEAQMHSFEKGWGWWYWTWKTEDAPLWSYEDGLKAGILPKKAYERDFNCDSDIPDFKEDGLPEYY